MPIGYRQSDWSTRRRYCARRGGHVPSADTNRVPRQATSPTTGARSGVTDVGVAGGNGLVPAVISGSDLRTLTLTSAWMATTDVATARDNDGADLLEADVGPLEALRQLSAHNQREPSAEIEALLVRLRHRAFRGVAAIQP